MKIGRYLSARRSTSLSESAFGRHRTTYLLALILACAAVWTSPTALTAATIPRIALTVRIDRTAGFAFTLEQRALAKAETVLRAGLVDVRWQECTGLNPSPICDVPPGPSGLLLVLRAGVPCHQDTSATLGSALVVRRAGGVLATVYVDCVASLATAANADVAVLLGRVAAHESGHLMMRTSAHARRGLMRPNWTPTEIRRNRQAAWAFTAGEVGDPASIWIFAVFGLVLVTGSYLLQRGRTETGPAHVETAPDHPMDQTRDDSPGAAWFKVTDDERHLLQVAG